MNIVKALASGFTVDQVLDLLGQKYPTMVSKLKSAKKTGYDIQKFLKTFEGASQKELSSFEERSKKSSNPIISGQSYSRQSSAQTQLPKIGKALGTAALAAGTMYGASRALPALAQGAMGALGGGPSPNVPPPMPGQGQIGPAPMANAPVAAPPIQHTTPASTGVAAAAVPTPQPQGPSVNSLQVINDMGLASKIDNLAQAGNTPEAIEAGLESGLTQGQRKWLSGEIRSGQAKPLREMIQDYLTAKPAQPQAPIQPAKPQAPIQPAKPQAPIQPAKPRSDIEITPTPSSKSQTEEDLANEWGAIEDVTYQKPIRPENADFWEKHIAEGTVNPPKSTKDRIRKVDSEVKRLETRFKSTKLSDREEAEETYNDLKKYRDYLKELDAHEVANKPKKGSVVATPEGIVGDVKDIKEKEALVQSDDGKVHKVKVEDLEQPSEDLIKAAQDLLKIPEVDRSSVISLVTVRPKSKQMFIQYHNGETYVYEDVPQEKVDEIANAMGKPVTTGKNIYGAWEEGKQDSRGAALIHGIIRDPKYAKDQEGKTWEKLGTPYDYWKKLRKQPKRKAK